MKKVPLITGKRTRQTTMRIWQAIKILKYTIGFIFFTFLVTYIWYSAESRSLALPVGSQSFYGFWLYLLGYSDIDNVQNSAKTIISVFGIFALALLSSVFTVSLFEFRRRMEVSTNILVWNEKDLKGSVALMNRNSDVYNVMITLYMDAGLDRLTATEFYPYIAKHDYKFASFPLQPGTILYKYLRNKIKHKGSSGLTLVIIADYIDSKDGQQHHACNKYHMGPKKRSFVVDYSVPELNKKHFLKAMETDTHADDAKFEEALTMSCFRFDMNQFHIINSNNLHSNITVKTGEAPATKRDILDVYMERRKPDDVTDAKSLLLTSDVHFHTGTEQGAFCMIYTENPLTGDWLKFYDMNCALSFGYYVSEGITVVLQVKRRNPYKHIIEETLTGEGQFNKSLQEIKDRTRADFETIDEVCFCVTYNDRREMKGEFSVIGCELLVPDEEPAAQ